MKRRAVRFTAGSLALGGVIAGVGWCLRDGGISVRLQPAPSEPPSPAAAMPRRVLPSPGFGTMISPLAGASLAAPKLPHHAAAYGGRYHRRQYEPAAKLAAKPATAVGAKPPPFQSALALPEPAFGLAAAQAQPPAGPAADAGDDSLAPPAPSQSVVLELIEAEPPIATMPPPLDPGEVVGLGIGTPAAQTATTAQPAPPALQPEPGTAARAPPPAAPAAVPPAPRLVLPEPQFAAAGSAAPALPAPAAVAPLRLAATSPGAPPLAPAATKPPATTGIAPPPSATRAGSLPSPAFGHVPTTEAAAPKLASDAPGPTPIARATIASPPSPGLPSPQFGLPPDTPAAAHSTSAAPAWAGTAAAPRLTLDDELILQIETSRGELEDTVEAYGTRTGVYLPLGELARLLDLAIKVSDDGHFASGWFISEKRKLSIDLHQGKAVIEGRELVLAPSDAVAFNGELYVRAQRFADLLPLTLTINLHAQTVTVQTKEPFPFEARLARDEIRDRLNAKAGKATATHWPAEQTPWSALSFPMADVEIRAGSDQSLGARLENDLHLAGDIAFMTGQLFLSSTTQDGLVASRIELGRRDPYAQLLGPLRASEFEMGDVGVAALPLGLRGASGRGAFVSNAPLEHASVFDTIDLRGVLPDGYEVELYRNNVLLGSTRTPVNGQYEFLAVPVDYGLNVFRMVFYGPQGQQHEEVRTISVGDGRLAKGQFTYTVGMIQKDASALGVYAPNYSPTQDFGTWRSTALLQYGLTAGLTTSLSAAQFTSEGEERWMVAGGLRSALAGIAMKLDLGMQNGGSAEVLGLGGKALGLTYTLTHSEYQGTFIDETRSATSEYLTRATELDINGALHFGHGVGALAMPVSGMFRSTRYANGATETDASLRGSSRVASVMLSNSLDFTQTATPGTPATSQLLGTFDLSTLSGSRTQYRGSLGYQMLPRPQLTNASIEIDHSFSDRATARASVSQTFLSPGGDTLLALSAARRFDRFTLSFDGSYGLGSGNYSVMLRLGFSLGRNPLTGAAFMRPPGLATGGAVAVRAFRDLNADGRFDDGDTVLPDVIFNSSTQQGKTDKNGIAFLGNLGDAHRTGIEIDSDALPDIDMAPATRGIEIVPRPGRIHVSNFAIQSLSEVEGTAYFGTDGKPQAVSGVILRLVNAAGKVIARQRTESDGFFLFEQIVPGSYTIQLDEDQAKRLAIKLGGTVTITAGPKGGTIRQKLLLMAD